MNLRQIKDRVVSKFMSIEPAVRSIRPEWLGEIIWYGVFVPIRLMIMIPVYLVVFILAFFWLHIIILVCGFFITKHTDPDAFERREHALITGKIFLRQMSTGTTGGLPFQKASGYFFLIGGKYESESGVTPEVKMVKVMGNVDGEYRSIEFPFDDARFIIDDNITEPYIQIEYTGLCVRNSEKTESFSDKSVIDEYEGSEWIQNRIYKIHCPSQYLPQQLNAFTL